MRKWVSLRPFLSSVSIGAEWAIKVQMWYGGGGGMCSSAMVHMNYALKKLVGFETPMALLPHYAVMVAWWVSEPRRLN